MKQKSGLVAIWGMFVVFIGLFIANMYFDIGHYLGIVIDKNSAMWLASEVCVLVLSIVMLVKNGLPNKKQVLVSLALAAPMFLAYQGVNFTSARTFIMIALCSMAALAIFNNYKTDAIRLVKGRSVGAFIGSIVIGLLVGIVFGTINLFLGGSPWSVNIAADAFLAALSPGFYEEVVWRTFLFAVCLYASRGVLNTKAKQFTSYFMMIVPHVILHTPQMFATEGLLAGLFAIAILTLLFGLPLALLQRKRDLTSAICAHWTIDVIRFCVLGLPF